MHIYVHIYIHIYIYMFIYIFIYLFIYVFQDGRVEDLDAQEEDSKSKLIEEYFIELF